MKQSVNRESGPHRTPWAYATPPFELVPGVYYVGNKSVSSHLFDTGEGLLLLDTPGILWPKFDDPDVGVKLAYTGAVKDDVLDVEALGCHLIRRLFERYHDSVGERYKLDGLPEDTPGYELLEAAGRKRGFLLRGGEIDTERMARVVLEEYRSGKLGRLTFEGPEEWEAAK